MKARSELLLPGPLLVRVLLWVAIFAVFPISVTTLPHSFRLEVLGLDSRAVSESISERVLARLAEAERKELDPWLRDDYRIAWITTLYASRGNKQAHVDASYRVLGLHPDKVFPQIVARRMAKLGDQFLIWFPPAALTPRKPVRSDRAITSAQGDRGVS